MKVLILAGGLGKRLRPKVDDIPKPMVEVLGRPFLAWQIDLLKKFGLRNIVLCTGYRGDKIREHFGDGEDFGVNIEYSEEEDPLSTGGAIKNARPHVAEEDKFIVMNGDTYLDLDFGDFLRFHRRKNGLASMALAELGEPSKAGFVKIDEDSRVIEFVEKDRGVGMVNAGVQAFNYRVFDLMPEEDKFTLEYDFFPEIVKTEKVFGYLTECYFRDIGTPNDYQRIKEELGEVV